jgi:hypothetical protein
VALVVKQNVTANPLHISFFGALLRRRQMALRTWSNNFLAKDCIKMSRGTVYPMSPLSSIQGIGRYAEGFCLRSYSRVLCGKIRPNLGIRCFIPNRSV